jgi:dTDP-4-amino-4,6-dideoxy-D-galactose acyltransferase
MNEVFANARRGKLLFYSPFNFIRGVREEDQLSLVFQKLGGIRTYECEIDNSKFEFYYEYLDWDTSFFGIRTIKLYNALYVIDSVERLSKAVSSFIDFVKSKYGSPTYLFLEAPSEDIQFIQALTGSAFKLVETRLTYFNDNIQSYTYDQRFKVRPATRDDIGNLTRVAAHMRNDYDRFHADTTFDVNIADSFLAKYIEEAVKGFSDIVLVPDADNLPSDSFLTADYLEKHWEAVGVKASKMVLSAVSSDTNRGWYLKLVSEMTYHFKHKGVEVAFMNTQSTNRAVFRVWEKLGYRLGATTHILTKAV